MCNISQGIYEEGVKDGLSQGLSQGLIKGEKRGEKRGEKKAKKKIALNMAELNIPLEKIAAATQEKASVIKKWIEEHKETVSG
jgi:predicted transposase YdaD